MGNRTMYLRHEIYARDGRRFSEFVLTELSLTPREYIGVRKAEMEKMWGSKAKTRTGMTADGRWVLDVRYAGGDDDGKPIERYFASASERTVEEAMAWNGDSGASEVIYINSDASGI